MKDHNQVTIIGRLTRDIELKSTSTGLMIASFSIANNKMKDREANFFDCTAFKQTAEVLQKYARKGSKLLLSGYLQQETWDNAEGKKQSKVKIIVNEVQLLDSKPKESGQETQPREEIENNEIPF